VIGDTINCVDIVDFDSLKCIAITHPKEKMATERVRFPRGWNINDVPIIG